MVNQPSKGDGAIVDEAKSEVDSNQLSEFRGIQALRCFAALLVVVTHTTDSWVGHVRFTPQPNSWGNGVVGVDLFFVISGFVMMASSSRMTMQLHPARVFLWRRIIRIVPLYWVLTTIKLVLIKYKPGLAIHSLPPTWNVISSYLFIPSYGASGEIRPVIPVGWTLNFEMMFYVLFASALAARVRVLYVLIPVLGCLSIAAFFRTAHSPAIYAFADPVVLDFLAGVLIAMCIKKLRTISPNLMMFFGGVGLFAILLYNPPAPISIARTLVVGFGATAVIAAVVACEPFLTRILPQWVLLLGDASYSIYLVQGFAIPIAAAALVRIGFFRVNISLGTSESVYGVIGVAMVILLALPMYLFVEEPMTLRLKRLALEERSGKVS